MSRKVLCPNCNIENTFCHGLCQKCDYKWRTGKIMHPVHGTYEDYKLTRTPKKVEEEEESESLSVIEADTKEPLKKDNNNDDAYIFNDDSGSDDGSLVDADFFFEENGNPISLLLNLTEYPEVIEHLKQSARRKIRTIELQAIAYIVLGLQKDGYGNTIEKVEHKDE